MPGAVARVDLGAARAAVLEGVEDVKRARHDLVRRLAGQARDRADAARVVLERRVVESRGLGSLCGGLSGGGVLGGTEAQEMQPPGGRLVSGTSRPPPLLAAE